MELYNSPDEYLFNLETSSSADAKRLWRKTIREKWNYKCAYCEAEEDLTIDHVIPQCKGGSDLSSNVVCCCNECNRSKSHTDWEDWFLNQDFYTEERHTAIREWTKPKRIPSPYRQTRRKVI